MAINFKNMKRSSERCIIYENEGIININKDNIEKLKEILDDYIIIKNPDDDIRSKILSIFQSKIKSDNQDVKVDFEDFEYLEFCFEMYKELTNIDFGDMNLKNNKEEVYEILLQPNELLRIVKCEIEAIFIQIFNEWYNNLKNISSLPENIISMSIESEKIKKEKNDIVKIKEKSKKRRIKKLNKENE